MDTTTISILAAIILACIALIFYFEWKARREHAAELREQDRLREQRRVEGWQRDIERELRKASMAQASPPMRTGASIQRNQGAASKRVENSAADSVYLSQIIAGTGGMVSCTSPKSGDSGTSSSPDSGSSCGSGD